MFFKLAFNPGDVHVTQTTVLEGIAYTLSFTYSQAEKCYYLSVGDPSVTDGSFLVSWIKLQTNRPLLQRWTGAAKAAAERNGNSSDIWPPGELYALSLTQDDSIAGLGDLGSR